MYKLLIIDDEQQIINGIKFTLDWQRYHISKIDWAMNYHDAIAKASILQPDIAIIDVRIGENWGYDILKEFKRLGLETKCIMISGYDDFEFVRESLLSGALEYLLKPIDRAKLETIIERIIVDELHGTIEPVASIEQHVDPILKMEYANLSKLTNKVLMIAKTEYAKNINLKFVADLFKMNSTYIGQVFLKETGMKFSEYLLAYRMLKAYEMIVETNEKISYIAHMVGFSHVNYFYVQFKNYFNVSPGHLRGWDEVESEEVLRNTPLSQ